MSKFNEHELELVPMDEEDQATDKSSDGWIGQRHYEKRLRQRREVADRREEIRYDSSGERRVLTDRRSINKQWESNYRI